MLLLNLILLIEVTFSTPTPHYTRPPSKVQNLKPGSREPVVPAGFFFAGQLNIVLAGQLNISRSIGPQVGVPRACHTYGDI